MLLDFIVTCLGCGHLADEHLHGGALFAPCDAYDCDCDCYIPDPDDQQRIMTEGSVSERMTLAEAEAIVGEPAHQWECRCFEISSALAERAGGVAVYGAWNGPIAEGTPFSNRPTELGPNHGWVLLPDGKIFDPTRWVFEGLDPYLYEGDSDFYDEGRNQFRAANLPKFPPASGEPVHLEVSDALATHLAELCGTPTTQLTANQWAWCANLPYDTLAGHAPELYSVLDAASLGAFIPWDNQMRAGREAA